MAAKGSGQRCVGEFGAKGMSSMKDAESFEVAFFMGKRRKH